MQSNLDAASLAGRTIAFPAPTSDAAAVAKSRRLPRSNSIYYLEQDRKGVVAISVGEGMAWLAIVLSAVTALVLSLWF